MLARTSADQPRLSIIDENSDTLPPLPCTPATASHRPFSKRWRDSPPAVNHENSPPGYSVWDVSGPRGEKLMDVRNNRYIVKRGGWKRLCLVLLILAALAIALGVGLGVGLKNKHKSDDNATASSDITNTTEPFPIGSYSLKTNLATVSTNCTANSATWRCNPYVTYSTSATQSIATFNWVIQGSLTALSISSSNNPFSISFNNVSLSLVDHETDNERYTFTVPLDKVVYPSSPVTDDNSSAACYFNGTEFRASLYTRRIPSSVNNGTNNNRSADAWTQWPHAVEVIQTIRGGSDVPNCYRIHDGALGSRVSSGLNAQSTQSLCECAWKNFDL